MPELERSASLRSASVRAHATQFALVASARVRRPVTTPPAPRRKVPSSRGSCGPRLLTRITDRPGNVLATYPRRLPSVSSVPHEVPAVDRCSAYADTAGARDRVGQRGGAGDRGRLAHALGAQRPYRRGHLDQVDVDKRDLVGGGHLVVEERCRAQLTVAVVNKLF